MGNLKMGWIEGIFIIWLEWSEPIYSQLLFLDFSQTDCWVCCKLLEKIQFARAIKLNAETVDFVFTIGKIEFICGEVEDNWFSFRTTIAIQHFEINIPKPSLRNHAILSQKAPKILCISSQWKFYSIHLSQNLLSKLLIQHIIPLLELIHHIIFTRPWNPIVML